MKSTQQYIDFDIPSWAEGWLERLATKFLHYYKDHNLHNLRLNKNAKNLLSLVCNTFSQIVFSKGGFTFFDFWFSFEPSFYLSQRILVVIICDRLRFTFPWTRLDQSGTEWSRVEQTGQPQFNCDMSTATGATHIGGGLPQQYISFDLKDNAFPPQLPIASCTPKKDL